MSGRDVAVVMPVHNGARYVAESLDSVLSQTLPPAEVVVVDDGSTDESPAILASYGDSIRVVTQSQAGMGTSINRGIACTTAPFLAFQDSDDVWLPTKLEVLVAELERAPELGAVFGSVVQFVSPELGPAVRRSFDYDPMPTPVELLTAGVVRRESWLLLNGLDSSIATSANIEWFSRALEAGLRYRTIDALVLRRRLHQSNIGVRLRDQKRVDLLDIVRRHLGRQRAVAGGAHE